MSSCHTNKITNPTVKLMFLCVQRQSFLTQVTNVPNNGGCLLVHMLWKVKSKSEPNFSVIKATKASVSLLSTSRSEKTLKTHHTKNINQSFQEKSFLIESKTTGHRTTGPHHGLLTHLKHSCTQSLVMLVFVSWKSGWARSKPWNT